jgi:hypothetical protein
MQKGLFGVALKFTLRAVTKSNPCSATLMNPPLLLRGKQAGMQPPYILGGSVLYVTHRAPRKKFNPPSIPAPFTAPFGTRYTRTQLSPHATQCHAGAEPSRNKVLRPRSADYPSERFSKLLTDEHK